MNNKKTTKPDYRIIETLITDGARVLDLGCGDGSLLKNLIEKKRVNGLGVDTASDGLNAAMQNGLSVLELDLNKGLASFGDKTFDFVVLNMTLQAMQNPHFIVKEMVRVGKKAIVGFPNFGHWKLIFNLLFAQRMPKTKTLPYEWYNTPNIRLMTVKDFKGLCNELGVSIIKETYLNDKGNKISGPLMNWRAVEGIFLLSK